MRLEESNTPDVMASRVKGGTFLEVPGVFARLGLTSFGGPIAHRGYFRQEVVVRRKWVAEEEYADLDERHPCSHRLRPGPLRRWAADCLEVAPWLVVLLSALLVLGVSLL